ncbi:MAG: CAAX prenyl protease-related protein [Verrucomicrobia bacterium]|nr:CAAX prenyl protease-related protein [Verrucomicrobiota bacterium]
MPILAAETEGAQRPAAHPFVVPFGVFVAFLALNGCLESVWPSAKLAVYPVQTLVCGYALWRFRTAYYPLLRATGLRFALAVGVFVLLVWVAPQTLHLAPPRTDGFNPGLLSGSPGLYAASLTLRFLRLVVVVPMLEEVFWRGFMLRVLIRADFAAVPFGTFTWTSCAGVAFLFSVEHQPADWPAGFVAGWLYNLVAYRTRNLGACVLAHAVTNLGLGIYVCATRQWGFW